MAGRPYPCGGQPVATVLRARPAKRPPLSNGCFSVAQTSWDLQAAEPQIEAAARLGGAAALGRAGDVDELSMRLWCRTTALGAVAQHASHHNSAVVIFLSCFKQHIGC